MIELKNLSKKFMTSDGEVQALKDVNITVGDGDIYGIIGMSGAGKSTLVRCINMLDPDRRRGHYKRTKHRRAFAVGTAKGAPKGHYDFSKL